MISASHLAPTTYIRVGIISKYLQRVQFDENEYNLCWLRIHTTFIIVLILLKRMAFALNSHFNKYEKDTNMFLKGYPLDVKTAPKN